MAETHESIRNLLGRYCELMDAGDFDGLADLFAAGRLSDENGTVFATGAAEIATRWHAQTILYNGSPRTRHVTANPIIELDEPAGTATARSSYVVFQATGDLRLQPMPVRRSLRTGRGRDMAMGRTQLRRRPRGRPLAPSAATGTN
jgi:hypothetical protein